MVFDEDGSNEQQNRDADKRELAAKPSMLVLVMMMVLMVLAALMLVVVLMMNMCHNFDPLLIFGCKVTAHFAQLGCKVSECVTHGHQHLMALVVDLGGLRNVGYGSSVEAERRVRLEGIERALRHRVLVSKIEVPAVILVA